MKIVHEWLSQLADVPADVETVAREISLRGFEVAEISNGVIDFEEFVALMADLDPKMPHPALKIGFHDIDTDKDGLISFGEFIDWWLAD